MGPVVFVREETVGRLRWGDVLGVLLVVCILAFCLVAVGVVSATGAASAPIMQGGAFELWRELRELLPPAFAGSSQGPSFPG